MRLSELDARILPKRPDRLLAGAEAVSMLCPKCFVANGGEVGTHRITIYLTPVSPRGWNPKGTTIDDLTLVPPGNVSVGVVGGCEAHFLVVDGAVRMT
jgi:hypothetical protein